MKTAGRQTILVALLALAGAMGARVSAAGLVSLHIAAQPLDRALNEFAQQTGLQVVFRADQVGGERTSKPLTGKFEAEEALKLLLADSGLQYSYVSTNTI